MNASVQRSQKKAIKIARRHGYVLADKNDVIKLNWYFYDRRERGGLFVLCRGLIGKVNSLITSDCLFFKPAPLLEVERKVARFGAGLEPEWDMNIDMTVQEAIEKHWIDPIRLKNQKEVRQALFHQTHA